MADISVGVIHMRARAIMQETSTPIRLWDYTYEYVYHICSLIVTDHYSLQHQTPFEIIHGYTPDISDFTTYKWFEWIWHYDPNTL